MMKFCADISHLDIECSILDIHFRWGARFERKARGVDKHSIRGVPRGHNAAQVQRPPRPCVVGE